MSDIEKQYQASLDYLYSFVDYSLTRQLRYSPEKFNLDRMNKLMQLMGEPHTAYPIVHIAGTKGKGSTAAMVASILQAAGYRVGLYTSPHLSDFTERIQVNSQPVSHSELIELVENLTPLAAQVEEITTFELTTALGFAAFKQAQADIAVIEVGLGGRLDATNIVKPEVSVITSLSMDHMNVLGDTLEKIAFEKGGIIKPQVPVVLSPQKAEARNVIAELCAQRQSKLVEVEANYKYGISSFSLDGQSFWVEEKNQFTQRRTFSLGLLGKHQVANAVTALATAEILISRGFSISENAMAQGFRNVHWPGRFEAVRRKPLVILDCAHNADSAMKLSATIQEYLPGKDVTIVFGASEDKDVKGMFEHLLPLCDHVIVTKSVHPRAADLDLLVELARQERKAAVAADTVEKAIEIAISNLGENGCVLITGSIFIAAAAREILQRAE